MLPRVSCLSCILVVIAESGMYLLYSILLTIGFLLMLPAFIFRRQKYAAGLSERLGNYPTFEHDGRKIIWLHCVSVGETNAARPLIDTIKKEFPSHRLVVSTTTRTGQELAKSIFKDQADAVFYFPIDWKFTVRRALRNFQPSVVLLMETEIWPGFLREAKRSGAKIAIVNGRISERSFHRYRKIRKLLSAVLANVDRALMQSEEDARRLIGLGMDADSIAVTGNIKFDLAPTENEVEITENIRRRFGVGPGRYLLVAASTHAPEERTLLAAFTRLYDGLETKPRMLIAPRHPARFDEVASLFRNSGHSMARRSDDAAPIDRDADIILLDSIGELRAVYPLADVVFVGGSLIPHGGQSVLEPASVGKAIVTGPFTSNFHDVIRKLKENHSIIQLTTTDSEAQAVDALVESLSKLLRDPVEREFVGKKSLAVMEANRGATQTTIDELRTTILS